MVNLVVHTLDFYLPFICFSLCTLVFDVSFFLDKYIDLTQHMHTDKYVLTNTICSLWSDVVTVKSTLIVTG